MDWDARYAAASGGLFGDAPNVWLTMLMARADFAARSMLLPADGDGRNGTWVAAQGLSVTAVDISAVATGKARARDAAAGVWVERITADLRDWTPSPARRWAAAAILYLQGPPSLRWRAVDLAMAALEPGGWLILEGFSIEQADHEIGPRDDDRLYDLDALCQRLGADWQVEEALTGRVCLREGPKHDGLAHVVRLAARAPGAPG